MRKRLIRHYLDFDHHYLCNKAIGIITGKITLFKFKVTCKNCKRILNK